MSPYEIRERAFKHLKNVGRDTAVSMAAAFCIPVLDLILALREPGDFRWIAGNGCWDYTLCPFARCRGDDSEARKLSTAARKSQAAFNDSNCKVAEVEGRSRVRSSQKIIDYLRKFPGTASDIARGLGWCKNRVYFQLHRLIDQLTTFIRPGTRVRIWSLR